MRRCRGFTLIELLVVVAIISLLSSVVLASLSGARESARDVRRKQDLRQIKRALHAYRNDNGDYMGIDSGCGRDDSGNGIGDGSGYFNYDGPNFSYDKAISSCLVDQGYLSTEILPPSGDKRGRNVYMKYTCSSGTILYANLESPDTDSLPPESEGYCSADYTETDHGMNYYLWVSQE